MPAKPSKSASRGPDPVYPSEPRSFRIGGAIRPTRDVGRFVRWPRYVRLQRQRKILQQRLKVPPAINQFARALDKNQTTELVNLLSKYVPETRAAKQERLRAQAAAGGDAAGAPPNVLKFGLNHVTTLIEERKAKLVVIAADVNPIELVVWLPALCRKMEVPYCIVKSKARLGQLVHMKNSAVVAVTNVDKADKHKLDSFCANFKAQFNDNSDAWRFWGSKVLGEKTNFRVAAREKAVQAELAKKASY